MLPRSAGCVRLINPTSLNLFLADLSPEELDAVAKAIWSWFVTADEPEMARGGGHDIRRKVVNESRAFTSLGPSYGITAPVVTL